MEIANSTVQPAANMTAAPVFEMREFQFPPSLTDITGIIVLMSMSFLANAGGLGGGGLLTPFMMMFFKLSIFECVPLANLFGLLAAATRFVVNFSQKHPNPKKAADGKLSIDYEIIMLTMPMLYLGTLFGVQIGTLLNEMWLAISLSLVMFFVTYKTTQKAINMYRTEKKATLNKAATQNLATTIQSAKGGYTYMAGEDEGEVIRSNELKKIIENESKHFPVGRIVNFFITLALLFSTSMLMGSKYQVDQLVEPIFAYIVLTIFILYAIISTIINARALRRIHKVKRRDGYVFDPSDISFDDNKTLL